MVVEDNFLLVVFTDGFIFEDDPVITHAEFPVALECLSQV